MTPLTIQEVEIIDYFGTEHVKFCPKTFTILAGSNGTGKSSILRAVGAIFDGGSDPSAIRKGAKKATIRLTVSNGITITKTQTAKGSTLEVLGPDKAPIPAPKTFVESLGKSWAVDPGKLMSIDASTKPGRKALVETLLQLVPMDFSSADIEAAALAMDKALASKYNAAELPSAYADALDEAVEYLPKLGEKILLSGLEKSKQAIEGGRRQLGQAKRDQEGVIQTLRASLPDGADNTDWQAEEATRQEQLDVLRKSEKAELDVLNLESETDLKAIADGYQLRERNLREEFQKALSAIEIERGIAYRTHASLKAAAVATIIDLHTPGILDLTEAVAEARERSDAQQRSEGVRIELKSYLAKCETSSTQYDRLTRVLETLDAAKKVKLDKLPVPGLEVDGDQVNLDGIEWQNVNTARRAAAVIAISESLAGQLPFLVYDGSEELDAQTFEDFKGAAIERGFQVLTARVLSGSKGEEIPLTITTE